MGGPISGGGGGFSNPMTTAGDLIVGGASGTPERLPLGAEGESPRVVGGALVYAAGVPDPTGAPDGQVVTTASGALVLATPSGGIDTSLQAAPDTGWTAASGAGIGTASIASGVATLTLGPSETRARLYRPIPTSPEAPMLEVTARVRRTAAAAGTDHGVGIGLTGAAWGKGYFMDARPSNGGEVRCFYGEGSWQFINSMNFISPGDLDAAPGSSSVWLRIVVTPAYVAFYTDTGATRPTSDWGRLGRLIRRPDVSIQSQGLMTQLEILALRGAGTGTAVFEVDNIAWRSLLGAPA